MWTWPPLHLASRVSSRQSCAEIGRHFVWELDSATSDLARAHTALNAVLRLEHTLSQDDLLGAKTTTYFPHHLVEGLLNFRRRVCRSFWQDLAFQDPPGKRTNNNDMVFFIPPTELSTRVLKPQRSFFSCPKPIFPTQSFFISLTVQYCTCLLYTSPSPRDYAASRMPSSA